MTDATFEDGAQKPLRLRAFDEEDLNVLSALAQDAVFPGSEMRWSRRERRFAILLNRFRWEDVPKGGARPAERVQSVLSIEEVEGVQTQGVTPGDEDMILSLLSLSFEKAGERPNGRVILTLAGDGAIAVQVEALEAVLRDVTRPYVAPSRKIPHHPE